MGYSHLPSGHVPPPGRSLRGRARRPDNGRSGGGHAQDGDSSGDSAPRAPSNLCPLARPRPGSSLPALLRPRIARTRSLRRWVGAIPLNPSALFDQLGQRFEESKSFGSLEAALRSASKDFDLLARIEGSGPPGEPRKTHSINGFLYTVEANDINGSLRQLSSIRPDVPTDRSQSNGGSAPRPTVARREVGALRPVPPPTSRQTSWVRTGPGDARLEDRRGPGSLRSEPNRRRWPDLSRIYVAAVAAPGDRTPGLFRVVGAGLDSAPTSEGSGVSPRTVQSCRFQRRSSGDTKKGVSGLPTGRRIRCRPRVGVRPSRGASGEGAETPEWKVPGVPEVWGFSCFLGPRGMKVPTSAPGQGPARSILRTALGARSQKRCLRVLRCLCRRTRRTLPVSAGPYARCF